MNPRVTSGGFFLPGGPMTPERQFMAILGRGEVFTLFFGFFMYFYNNTGGEI